MARQYLSLMARRLPDMRRSLVDLRLKVVERAEVLVRQVPAGPSQPEPALKLATSRLFLQSPRRTLAWPGSAWPRRARCWGNAWCRAQQQRQHLDAGQNQLEQMNPAGRPGAGLHGGHLCSPRETVVRDATLVPPAQYPGHGEAHGRMDFLHDVGGSDE